MAVIKSINLWNAVCSELDAGLPGWKERIVNAKQVSTVEDREKGRLFSDSEIFEGIVKAVLSNSTDWSKVEKILPDLHFLFNGFDPECHATRSEHEIEEIFLPWFRDRKVGALTLRKSLKSLIKAARNLCEQSRKAGSLDRYLCSLLEANGGKTISLARQLGALGSPHKLPSMGIPIAAEALKNVGFDVAKPDRHIMRALGSFGLVQFSRWPDRSSYSPPQATESKMIEVMLTMERIASDVGLRVSFLDNAVWMLCSKSGLHLTNRNIAALL